MAWTQQRPSGNWTGFYRDGSGKPRSAGTFPHELKALAIATDREAESRLPGWRDPKAAGRKWGDWCAEWWPTRNVAASTLRADTSLRDNHLLPYWKDVPLADITRLSIKAWAVKLALPKEAGGGGLAESSVARSVRVFSSSLSGAIDAEILRYNPAFRLGLTMGETDIVRFYTRKQVSKMLKALEGRPRDRAIMALLVGCGLRWGEMAGLTPRRVDLKRKKLRVAETIDQATGKVKKYPKGKRIRDVPIPDWVLAEIRPFAEADEDRLFPHLIASNWRRDVWTKIKPKGGGRIHDLRHTYASWLLQDGVPLAEVSRLMGHSSQRVTERYAHLIESFHPGVEHALRDPRG